MAEKYSISGRIDSFEYQVFSAASPINAKSTPEGLLTGVTGGSITWDDETDLKVNGSLTVCDAKMLHNKYIRIYYVTKIPTVNANGSVTWKTYKYMLATCYADTERGHLENGKYSGTITLDGTLSRYIDDETTTNICLSKNSSILNHLKKLFSWYGGSYTIKGLKDRKTSQAHVWDFGSSPFTLIGETAAYIQGVITCGRDGTANVVKWVAPSKRTRSYSYPVGGESVTLVGIDIESTQGKAYNRAAVKYIKTEEYRGSDGKKKTKQTPIYGLASLTSSSTASKAHTGRYRTYTETIDTLPKGKETAKQANTVAKNLLANVGGYITVYTVKSLFLPIEIGQVVRFRYEKIDVDALVVSIRYDLSLGCPMTVVLRKIRDNK